MPFTLRRLVIPGVLATIGVIPFLPRPALAADYQIGDTLTSTIRYSSTSLIVSSDIQVHVTNGQLISIRCGGSGFSVILAQGNRCVAAHLVPGLASGTLAMVTVRATGAGTVTIGATGSFQDALALPAVATLTGDSFSVAAAATPNPTPSATATPSSSPTSNLPANPVSTATAAASPTATDTQRDTSQVSASAAPSPDPSDNGVITPTPSDSMAATESGVDRIVLSPLVPAVESANGTATSRPLADDAATNAGFSNDSSAAELTVISPTDTAKRLPITIRKTGEVVFAAKSLSADQSQPVDVTLPSASDTSINLSAYMASGSSKPYLVLPQAIVFHETSGGNTATVTFPKDLILSPSGNDASALSWNGILDGPHFSVISSRMNYDVLLGMGDALNGLELNKAVSISLPANRPGIQAGGKALITTWNPSPASVLQIFLQASACPTTLHA